jgi:hypothetical protein
VCTTTLLSWVWVLRRDFFSILWYKIFDKFSPEKRKKKKERLVKHTQKSRISYYFVKKRDKFCPIKVVLLRYVLSNALFVCVCTKHVHAIYIYNRINCFVPWSKGRIMSLTYNKNGLVTIPLFLGTCVWTSDGTLEDWLLNKLIKKKISIFSNISDF